jgi:hypothetical protein
MTDKNVNVVVNNLRGIQAEINRLDTTKLEKLNIRKKYITDCLNNGGISQADCGPVRY